MLLGLFWYMTKRVHSQLSISFYSEWYITTWDWSMERILNCLIWCRDNSEVNKLVKITIFHRVFVNWKPVFPELVWLMCVLCTKVNLRVEGICRQYWFVKMHEHLFYKIYNTVCLNLSRKTILLNSFQCNILCRFRCRNNYLPISSWRSYSLTDEEMQCPLYIEEEVGDEMHYLFIDKEFLCQRRVQSFKNWMSSSSINVLRQLAMLTEIVMSKFKN